MSADRDLGLLRTSSWVGLGRGLVERAVAATYQPGSGFTRTAECRACTSVRTSSPTVLPASAPSEEFDPVGGAHDVEHPGRPGSNVAVAVRSAARDEDVVARAGDGHFVTEAHLVLALQNEEGLLVAGVDVIPNARLAGWVAALDEGVARVAPGWL